MTVADVLAGGVDGYQERVAAWARSIVIALDAAGARADAANEWEEHR